MWGASLDASNNMPEYGDCAKRMRLNDITYRAAVIITSVPLDRSRNAAGSLALAILLGCEEPSGKEAR